VRTNGAITAGEKLQHQLTDTTTLKHATTAVWKADDVADGLSTVAVDVMVRMSQNLQDRRSAGHVHGSATHRGDREERRRLVVAVTVKY
jgi:hypothetical protein